MWPALLQTVVGREKRDLGASFSNINEKLGNQVPVAYINFHAYYSHP